jgi:hypothetical protein
MPRGDAQASYDFAVTYDRDLVITVAHSLVQRMSAPSTNTTAAAVR